MNFKLVVLVLLFVFVACTIVTDNSSSSGKPNIYCIIRTGDSNASVIVDSSVSISSSADRSSLFIEDASVSINRVNASLENVSQESLGYNYVYRINTKIEGEKRFDLLVNIDGEEYSASALSPKAVSFKFREDSSVLFIDTMSFLVWNKAGIDFYFIQFYEKTDSGSFNTFSMGVQNDTMAFLFPFSFALPDSAVYDITVTAMDSSYLMGIMGNESSFGENAYGRFGAVSVGTLHDIIMLK